MGARLEYILIPLAFGIGTAIVAMVGTNWGAKQYDRARRVAWVGGITTGAACAAIGLIVALFPGLWMGLFTNDGTIIDVGASYLRIVGPIYGLYGFGMALYFATQGLGRPLVTVASNGLRLAISAGAALLAEYFFKADSIGMFFAIAVGFLAYGGINALALLCTKAPADSRR
jgi:Na+-driven multidrug efflux pump